MNIPKHTIDIFETLSKGQFISSNSTDDRMSKLYSIIEHEDNFNLLFKYFQHIGFILEAGNEYYYFSRIEKKVDLQRKLDKAFKWIDTIDFFKTFDPVFGSGFRFTPAQIQVKLRTDADLKSKFKSLRKRSDRSSEFEAIVNITNNLVSDNFVELEDEFSQTYKVLMSFDYLERLVKSINISENTTNEIPQ